MCMWLGTHAHAVISSCNQTLSAFDDKGGGGGGARERDRKRETHAKQSKTTTETGGRKHSNANGKQRPAGRLPRTCPQKQADNRLWSPVLKNRQTTGPEHLSSKTDTQRQTDRQTRGPEHLSLKKDNRPWKPVSKTDRQQPLNTCLKDTQTDNSPWTPVLKDRQTDNRPWTPVLKDRQTDRQQAPNTCLQRQTDSRPWTPVLKDRQTASPEWKLKCALGQSEVGTWKILPPLSCVAGSQ